MRLYFRGLQLREELSKPHLALAPLQIGQQVLSGVLLTLAHIPLPRVPGVQQERQQRGKDADDDAELYQGQGGRDGDGRAGVAADFRRGDLGHAH